MTAGPAAGSGGSRPPTKRAAAPRSRSQKLSAAHAAGKSGKAAPAWIDDAELLDAYDQGASGLGDAWAGDSDTTDSDNAAAAPEPAAEPQTPPAGTTTPEGSGNGLKMRSVPPVRSGGDTAGAFLGIIFAAFLTNVLRGTWSQWLRAKFLNETGASSPAAAAPASGANPTAGPANVAGSPYNGIAAPGSTINSLTGGLSQTLSGTGTL